MEEATFQKVKYEYLNPNRIESEVPGRQELRGRDDTKPPVKENDNEGSQLEAAANDDSKLVSVLTVTKKEIDDCPRDETTAATDSTLLHTTITRESQYSEDVNGSSGEETKREVDNDDTDERDKIDNNGKSRIPILKFRHAVEKIKQERKSAIESDNSNAEVTIRTKRRSSIPRLKRVLDQRNEELNKRNGIIESKVEPVNNKATKMEQMTKNQERNTHNNIFDKIKPDEEFDKIYEEIADDRVSITAIEEVILNTQMDDIVKLESKFDEIVDSINDQETQNVSIENETKPSKIPVLINKLDQTVILSRHSKNRALQKSYSIDVNHMANQMNDDDKNVNRFNLIRQKSDSTKQDMETVQKNKVLKSTELNSSRDVLKRLEKLRQVYSKTDEDNFRVDIENMNNNAMYINKSRDATPNEEETCGHNNSLNNKNNSDIRSEPTKQTKDATKDFSSDNINNSLNIIRSPNAAVKSLTEEANDKEIKSNRNHVDQSEIKRIHDIKYSEPLVYSDKIRTCDLKLDIPILNDNKNIEQLKNTNTSDDEDPPILKGKVNRLISRLLSVDANNKTEKQINIDRQESRGNIRGEITGDLHNLDKVSPQQNSSKYKTENLLKGNSVLSKIALFEAQEQTDNHTVTRSRKLIFTTKPKIVDEILKSSYSDFSLNDNRVHNQMNTNLKTNRINFPTTNNSTVVVNKIKFKKTTSNPNEMKLQNENETEYKISSDHDDNSTMKTKSSNEIPNKVATYSVENYKTKNSNMTSRNDFSENTITNGYGNTEEPNTIKERSLTSVKGKVKAMIIRINSMEILETNKKETISIKEKPRERTVLEKIALFEGKLNTTREENGGDDKPKDQDKVEQGSTNTDYYDRIAELRSGVNTYGKGFNMTYRTLRDGNIMPVMFVGTALLEPKLTPTIIETAIDLGYRGIDTAFIYGNEAEVGQGINAKIQDGTVKREDLFVIGKLWNTFHHPNLVEVACKKSLSTLGLTYFDLYLIHSPISFKENGDVIPMMGNEIQYSDFDYMDAYYAMEKLVKKGWAKSIGVSNFNEKQLARILSHAAVRPVVNQVECNPYLTQERLHNYCRQNGIQTISYSPLGSKGTPKGLKAVDAPVIDDPTVRILAAGLEITPAQLLIAYQMAKGYSVVVKASSALHMYENIKALNVSLQQNCVEALDNLNRNQRTFDYKNMGATHKNYPFNEVI